MPQFNQLGQKIQEKVGSEDIASCIASSPAALGSHKASSYQHFEGGLGWVGCFPSPYLSQFSELFYSLLLPFTNLSHNLSIAEHVGREFFLVILGKLQETAQVRTASCSQLWVLFSLLHTHTLNWRLETSALVSISSVSIWFCVSLPPSWGLSSFTLQQENLSLKFIFHQFLGYSITKQLLQSISAQQETMSCALKVAQLPSPEQAYVGWNLWRLWEGKPGDVCVKDTFLSGHPGATLAVTLTSAELGLKPLHSGCYTYLVHNPLVCAIANILWRLLS